MKKLTSNTKMRFRLLFLAAMSLTLPFQAWSGESCNALLKLGLYNVTQSSSSIDAQSLVTSTFCSYDYSQISETSSQAATIKAAYGLFSGGASGSTSRQEIITKQSQICTSGYDSSKYISTATAYSKTVYQGSLDAWNKCQAIAAQNLNFNVQPSSTMQGISVSISVPPGYDAWFYGVAQYGVGHSDCSIFGTNGLLNVTASSPVKVNAASLVTISCARQMDRIGNEFIADSQDLVFITSKDNLTVPLASIGSLARATSDQINAQTDGKIKAAITMLNPKVTLIFSKDYDMNRPGNNGAACAAWDEVLVKSTNTMCYIAGIKGRFMGAGESAIIAKEGTNWVFHGHSCQQDVWARINCFSVTK